MRKILTLCSLMTMSACVTTHVGKEVTSADKQYAFSCGKDPQVDTPYFIAISCSVENTSDNWTTFQAESFAFVDAGPDVKISTADEINDFYAAYRFKKEKDAHNIDMALAGLAIGGAAVAIGSKNSTNASLGGAAAVGALGASTGRGVAQAHNKAQYGDVYGPNHLLGGAFRVPPKLFVRKSVIIETKDPKNLPDKIKVCMAQPKKECLEVPYRGR